MTAQLYKFPGTSRHHCHGCADLQERLKREIALSERRLEALRATEEQSRLLAGVVEDMNRELHRATRWRTWLRRMFCKARAKG